MIKRLTWLQWMGIALFVGGILAASQIQPGSVTDYLRGVWVGVVLGLFALLMLRKGARSDRDPRGPSV